MNYNNWQIKELSLGSLFLDPKNPRLPRKDKRYTQNEIIAELVQRNDVYDIARNIAEDGYSPMELIVVFKDEEDGKKYVLEGNRRLTACKLLHNPDLAPDKFKKKYKLQSQKIDPNDVSKLKAVIAPDRESAYRMIVRKHTKATVKDWRPIMQAHFYARPVEDGLSILEASDLLGVPEGEVRAAISSLQLYEASKKLDLEEKAKDVVEDEYKFELSTFERVITKPKAREFLGIENDEHGNIIVNIDPNEFKKGLRKIITDLALKKEDSRSLNRADDIENYLKDRIGDEDRPDLTKKNPGQKITEIFNPPEEEGKDEETPEPEPPKPRPPRTPTGLIPSGIACTVENTRVQEVFKEVKKLSPRTYPNASAMSLRMLIELSTYEYLKTIGELTTWESELKTKGERLPKLWVPELKPMLNRIVNNNLISDAQVTKTIRLMINDNSSAPILSALNQFVHNSSWHPNEDKLRNIWKDIEEYMKIVLKKGETA